MANGPGSLPDRCDLCCECAKSPAKKISPWCTYTEQRSEPALARLQPWRSDLFRGSCPVGSWHHLAVERPSLDMHVIVVTARSRTRPTFARWSRHFERRGGGWHIGIPHALSRRS